MSSALGNLSIHLVVIDQQDIGSAYWFPGHVGSRWLEVGSPSLLNDAHTAVNVELLTVSFDGLEARVSRHKLGSIALDHQSVCSRLA